MKILQISNSFSPVIGGQERVVYEISKELVKKGHSVTVLTSDYLCPKDIKSSEIIDGIKVIRLKNKYWLGGYGYVPSMKNWLLENYSRFDIVHCHGYNRYMAENAIRFLHKKIPMVFTPHGFRHTKKNNFLKNVHDFLFMRTLNKADKLTMLTKLDLIDYARLGIPRNKTVEIPNGVNIKKFSSPKKSLIDSFKKKYNLRDKKIILSVGRIHESKGFQYLIGAMKDIDCKLLIVGPDAGYKSRLLELIKSNHLEKKVIFTGRVNDNELSLAYHSCDLFVLFSSWEGFGLVVIEAMASKKPVIVSNRGSLAFLVKNNQNGFAIDYENTDELRNKIKAVLSTPSLVKKFIKNGFSTAQKYDWKKITLLNLRLYSSLITSK